MCDLALKPYAPGDELLVEARADFAAQIGREGGVLPEGPKWTVTAGGQVVGVAGLEHLGGRRWAAWAYMAALRPRQWLAAGALTRERLGGLDWLAASISAVATPDPKHHAAAVRLLKRIGFVEVGAPYMVWEG
ncbi:hypothetical protein [Caulobacter hibisci]|uniref:N-acetyltransferase domain-containing protein n=1 Tax=Caulobacter hibisci TaxID=2035993 RepID=A0ABS0SXU5_9CAUL|nr:hypothetical protein [Caulobacter hibisci]MBI1684462.1 hypothetical protein [Caulobacter hibisci]